MVPGGGGRVLQKFLEELGFYRSKSANIGQAFYPEGGFSERTRGCFVVGKLSLI
jgi:hypothetical protein